MVPKKIGITSTSISVAILLVVMISTTSGSGVPKASAQLTECAYNYIHHIDSTCLSTTGPDGPTYPPMKQPLGCAGVLNFPSSGGWSVPQGPSGPTTAPNPPGSYPSPSGPTTAPNPIGIVPPGLACK